MSELQKFAVMGSPIAHSLSPTIHAQYAAQCGITLSYSKIEATQTDFASKLQQFFAAGGRGVNVTMPCKRLAFELCDTHGPYATRCGNVNTLIKQPDGSLYGESTDGIGFLRDITQTKHFDITDKQVLILGAGNTATSIIAALADAPLKHCHIANRTHAHAEQCKELWQQMGTLTTSGLHDIPNKNWDLVVHTTSATSLALPPIHLSETSWCIDINYAEQDSTFMDWARMQDAVYVANGLGMLAAQAAESFYLWHGIMPEPHAQ